MAETTQENSKQYPQISLTPLLAVNFIGAMGFSIVLPFLVFLVSKWGGNALLYGLAGAIYSAFQLVGAPILGKWSDRIGRRKILLLSQIGTLVSWLILIVAFTLPIDSLIDIDSSVLGSFSLTLPLILLFVARAADGLTGGNISVANAYLADITPESSRNQGFGKMAVSANVGFVVGPAIAGLLGATAYGEIVPVIAAAVVSALAAILILVRLPESNPCLMTAPPEQTSIRKVLGQEQKECFETASEGSVSFATIVADRKTLLLLVIYFLVMLGFSFFYVTFPAHAAGPLNWTVTQTGAFFAVTSILMVVVQGPVLKQVSKRWNERILIPIGGLILAVGFLFFVLPQTWQIYTGTTLLAAGNGLMWPSVVSLLSKVAGPKEQGAVQGLAGSVGAVASVVGLILGGLLYGLIESSVFALAAATILVSFVLSLFVRVSPEATAG